MIILDTTTRSLTVKMGGSHTTSNPDYVVSYVDITATGISAASSDGALNDSTRVTAIAAPASSTERQIKFIGINNKDTISQTLTLELDDNGTYRTIASFVVPANYGLYFNGESFYMMDSNGSLLTNIGASGFLVASNNLSDLTSASTARTNLGLGSIATHATSDFAATANNLSDLGSASTARTNLGLGTAATHAATDFLQASNNLSDVGNAATSLANIGGLNQGQILARISLRI